MTKLERAYIEKIVELNYHMMKDAEREGDHERRLLWFHEWLAADSILHGLEDKEHMKMMIKD